MTAKKQSKFVIGIVLSLLIYGVVSMIPTQNIYAQPTVTISQNCNDGNFELTISASGFPPAPNQGVILVDGELSSATSFSPTGTMGIGAGGLGGPVYGPGLHTVIVFHDANDNQKQDPGEISTSDTFTSIVCGPIPCTLASSPGRTDSTEMNTIITESNTGSKVKTLYVESEVYRCQAEIQPDSFWPTIVDVSLHTEIIDDPLMKDTKNFEVITCQKNATNGELLGDCTKYIPTSNLPTVSYCTSISVQSPIELNTVIISPGIVKTIEAKKEFFLCDTPSKPKIIKDVTIFTEILENLSTAGTTKKTLEVTTCLKEIKSAKVLGCDTTTSKPL